MTLPVPWRIAKTITLSCRHSGSSVRNKKSDAQHASMEQFTRECAATAGRNVWTGLQTGTQAGGRGGHAQLAGPDATDTCSATTDYGSCSGSCGWCMDEVTSRRALRRNPDGWCSSTCVTTDGECPADAAGSGH